MVEHDYGVAEVLAGYHCQAQATKQGGIAMGDHRQQLGSYMLQVHGLVTFEESSEL